MFSFWIDLVLNFWIYKSDDRVELESLWIHLCIPFVIAGYLFGLGIRNWGYVIDTTILPK